MHKGRLWRRLMTLVGCLVLNVLSFVMPRLSLEFRNLAIDWSSSQLVPRIWPLLSDSERAGIVNAVIGCGQDNVPDAPGDTARYVHDGGYSGPIPDRIQLFEGLYDPATGNWHAPPEPVRIKVFDKKYFPGLVYDSVELDTARLYYTLVRMIEPTYILETGVSRGYSTACLAAGLKAAGIEGHVYAIDPANYPHLWDDTDLERYITWIPKRSQDSLGDVREVVFDLLVIDSLHDYDTCFWEIANFEKLLRPGGYILMHDSLHYDGVGAVVRQLSQNPRFEAVTLPTARGKGDHPPIPAKDNALLPVLPRRSGLTIVRKVRDGKPDLLFDINYKGVSWGDKSQGSLLLREL